MSEKSYKLNKASHLLERLEQIATRDRQSNVYMVHDEKRFLLGLVWETGQVVCYEQQPVHLCFLQETTLHGLN